MPPAGSSPESDPPPPSLFSDGSDGSPSEPEPESEGGGVSSRGVWRTNLPAALRIKRPSASIARGDAKPSTAPQPRKRRGGQCVTIQIR